MPPFPAGSAGARLGGYRLALQCNVTDLPPLGSQDLRILLLYNAESWRGRGVATSQGEIFSPRAFPCLRQDYQQVGSLGSSWLLLILTSCSLLLPHRNLRGRHGGALLIYLCRFISTLTYGLLRWDVTIPIKVPKSWAILFWVWVREPVA